MEFWVSLKLNKYGTSTIDVNYTSRTGGKWRFSPLALSNTKQDENDHKAIGCCHLPEALGIEQARGGV